MKFSRNSNTRIGLKSWIYLKTVEYLSCFIRVFDITTLRLSRSVLKTFHVNSNWSFRLPAQKMFIRLQKLNSLPLSDLAYMKTNNSSSFKMNDQNITTLFSYHQRAIWFPDQWPCLTRSLTNFKPNIAVHTFVNAVLTLKGKNRGLEEACGVSRSVCFLPVLWDKLNWENSKKTG